MSHLLSLEGQPRGWWVGNFLHHIDFGCRIGWRIWKSNPLVNLPTHHWVIALLVKIFRLNLNFLNFFCIGCSIPHNFAKILGPPYLPNWEGGQGVIKKIWKNHFLISQPFSSHNGTWCQNFPSHHPLGDSTLSWHKQMQRGLLWGSHVALFFNLHVAESQQAKATPSPGLQSLPFSTMPLPHIQRDIFCQLGVWINKAHGICLPACYPCHEWAWR